jgi:hypothetical protein
MDGSPKPALARFFEAIAAVMDLDHGGQTLELHFEGPSSPRWHTHFGPWPNESLVAAELAA